ncbi:MAG: FAD-dependent monooxygenase [Pseudomonadota bacterium]|nr:FAD-dependent monooxygenase [Pseudomonadota bacterium]
MATRALIVGGSLSGLMNGILLHQAGWDVEIYERVAEDLSGRGGGIATQDALWEVIAGTGIDVTARPGVRLGRRVVYASDGSVVAEQPTTQVVSSWDTLYRLLIKYLPHERYHQGVSVTGAVQDAGGAVLQTEDGPCATADLVVAADGQGSTLRSVLLPELAPDYAGYVAWRGLVDEASLDSATRAALVDAMAFCTPVGEQMLAYTVPGADDDLRPDHRRQNFVWYRPAPCCATGSPGATGRCMNRRSRLPRSVTRLSKRYAKTRSGCCRRHSRRWCARRRTRSFSRSATCAARGWRSAASPWSATPR